MNLKYTKEHLWGKSETIDTFTFGLSDFAQKELGEIVYVELPDIGINVASGAPICVIESLKSVSELYAPAAGIINAANRNLIDNNGCRLINTDPLGAGWIFSIQFNNPEDFQTLLSPNEYKMLTAE